MASPRPSEDKASKIPAVAVKEAGALTVQNGIPLPCVLPQTSKAFRGTYFSPFVRAWVPELAAHGIDQDTFIAFIDGLNEAFVAHPAFEAVNIVSSVISMSVPLPEIQYIFGGISIGAILASKATSYARTKAYLKAINVDLFHPAGLDVKVMTTKLMMENVGCSEFNLPPLDTFADIDEKGLADPMEEDAIVAKTLSNDPRMRRIKALEGYVMPLDFDVPEAVSPDNLIKRMGDAHAQRLSRKQQEKMIKKREKGTEKYHEKLEKAEERRLKGEHEIAKLERKLDNERSAYESKLNMGKGAHDAEEREKIIHNYEKKTAKIQEKIEKERNKIEEDVGQYQQDAEEKLQKPNEKEEKVAKKIRWVVITRWSGGEEDGDELSPIPSNPSEL